MRKQLPRRGGRRRGGFTLIELLIVLTILAILVAVVTLALTQFIGKGEEEACEADADALQIASLAFYHDKNGDWPESYAALIADGYIDKVPESDEDCDWGIGQAASLNLLAKNRICYGASDASITTCPCTLAGGADPDTGIPVCDSVTADAVIDLAPPGP